MNGTSAARRLMSGPRATRTETQLKDFIDLNIIVLDLFLFNIQISCVPAFGRLDDPKRIYLRASV
jgi:hypothetical protein